MKKKPDFRSPTAVRDILIKVLDIKPDAGFKMQLGLLGRDVIPALKAGDGTPLCDLLEQFGPVCLADEQVQRELQTLWLRAPEDPQARQILFSLGSALARVKYTGRPITRSAQERRHAVAIARSVPRWLERFSRLAERIGEKEARKQVITKFDFSDRIKDEERKKSIREELIRRMERKKA